jgi:O-antigen ligase
VLLERSQRTILGTDPLIASRARAAKPAFAATLIALGIVCLPLLLPALPGNAAPVDLVLAAGIVGVLFSGSSTGATLHVPYIVPSAILVGTGLLAGALGRYPGVSVLAVSQDIMLVAWCAAVASVITSRDVLRRLLGAWSVSSIAWATLLVAAAATGRSGLAGMATEQGRASLTLGNPNIAADYFVVSFMVVLAAPSPRSRAFRIAGCAVIAAAILLTGSLAGIGALAVGSAVAAVVTIHRARGLVPAVATLLAVALASTLVLIVGRAYHADIRAQDSSNAVLRNSLGRGTRSSDTHSEQLRQVVDLYWKEGPLGSGPATTKQLLSATGAAQVKEAHDDYEATLVERGLVGMVGLALLIGGVVYRVTHIGRRPSALTEGGYRSSAPLVGAVAAIGFSSIFHEVLHFRHVWALFGLIAGIYLLERTPEPIHRVPILSQSRDGASASDVGSR